MRLSLPILTGLTCLALGASAAHAASFTVAPGKIQLVEFSSEAPIEDIRGISTDASGALEVNLQDATKVTGTLTIPVASLKTGNTVRDGHLQQEMWLDAKAHPTITFKALSATFEAVKPLADGVTLTGTVTGEITIKGVTKPLTAPIKVSYLAASEKLKKVWIQGNAIRVKTKFEVTLADFGVKAPDHLAGIKVAETVSVKAAVTGTDG